MKLVVQQPGAREIKLKLLLAGGQSAALVLSPEHPLLAQLLGAIADRSSGAGGNRALFQIPMEGGRASLTFAADQLVGVVTDPAVMIQADGQADAAAAPSLSPAVAAAAEISAAQGHPGLVRHPVVQLDGFLTGSEVAWLMELAFASEHSFIPSRLSDNRSDYRHSLVMAAPHELWELIGGKIRAVMPEVMPQLRVGKFTVGDVDCQITASIDGSYFKVHTDAGRNETEKRQLTYVYYFNREPKGFTGGELRIYDDAIRNGKLSATDSFQVIEPRHNSMVFFQAAVMHEVMPVTVPSKAFRDARFTVNGWVDRV
ncbi:MAG TPA: 2OG-Fe(II) oxygenase [Casimicrobiaceae bacterium]|nr:2OG-Fe(II) oxygenase [Casimicrobiaceae bacterium]